MTVRPVKLYLLETCSSCRKALQFLKQQGREVHQVKVREQPPETDELRAALRQTGSLKRLLNTSGQRYRALGLAAKLPELTESEMLEMLSRDGDLVKRPLLVLADGRATAGFDPEEWTGLLAEPEP